MKKNIAVIGCGYWGKNLVRNFYDLGQLHTICDSDTWVTEKCKETYKDVVFTQSFAEVFDNCDIKGVVIATPAETHFALTKKALEHGKDVFVEKPLALDLKSGRDLVKLADRYKRILMVDHLLLYHPAVIKLKRMISSGKLGDIQYIYSNRLSIGKFRREENILWSFAPHDVSVILSLTGKMPTKVRTFGEAYLQPRIYDTTLTTLSFDGKLKAHIFVNWLHPFKEQKLVVIGTKNMAVFNDRIADKLILYPHKVKWVGGMPMAAKAPHKVISLPAHEPLKNACRHFIARLKDRKKPLTDGREGVRVLKVLQRAQEARS